MSNDQSLNQKKTCNSMNVRLTNQSGSVSFPCPQCGEFEINRCKHARKIVSQYNCPNCGFEGPN